MLAVSLHGWSCYSRTFQCLFIYKTLCSCLSVGMCVCVVWFRMRIFHMMVALTPLLLQKVKMATGLAVEMAAVSWFPKVRCEPERPSGVQYSKHFRIAPSQSKAQQLLDEDIVVLLRWPMSGVWPDSSVSLHCLVSSFGSNLWQRYAKMHSYAFFAFQWHWWDLSHANYLMPTTPSWHILAMSCFEQRLHHIYATLPDCFHQQAGALWPRFALKTVLSQRFSWCQWDSMGFNGIQSAHPKFPRNSLRASKLAVSTVLSAYQQSWCWVPQLHLIPRTANRSREAKRIQKMHPSIFRTNHNTRVDLHQDLLSHKRSENLNYRILYHVEVATD